MGLFNRVGEHGLQTNARYTYVAMINSLFAWDSNPCGSTSFVRRRPEGHCINKIRYSLAVTHGASTRGGGGPAERGDMAHP